MYFRELVKEVGTILLRVYKYSEVASKLCFKVCKSQVRKFFRYVSPQIANEPKIANPQISTKYRTTQNNTKSRLLT
jgi:hypothetical protein